MNVYVIGSLRDPNIPKVSELIRRDGHDVFDDWYAAGPEADDYWQRYEQAKGVHYKDALKGKAARNVFDFDHRHLDAADAAVLVLPCGKSGHLELGWMLGKGKLGFVLFPDGEPQRS